MPNVTGAQTLFEELVMPGDLIEGHAKLESECATCHLSFSEEGESQLCADCHTEVGQDILMRRGFHGRRPEARDQECRSCHTDHVGREADIIQLDRETFIHADTDFPLNGAHAILPCATCHADGEKFREAPSECVDCHEEDEPHEERLGQNCAACHTETDWSEVREFDHSETRFALDGTHKEVACAACHAGEIYTELPMACIGCHRIQDVHEGSLGEKCETCHSLTKWTDVRFDHDRDTKFPLTFAHETVQCKDCHTTNAYEESPGTDCAACHLNDDPHQGQLGEACETCHNPAGWQESVAFDHDITRFPLLGLHTLVPCEECHVDSEFRTADLACASCHLEDDVHKGSLTQECETCHNPNGWEFWIFDHDTQTDFTLTGAHEGLACSICHTPDRSDSSDISQTCASCHAKDDVHRGQFGQNCSLCHDTNIFKGAKLRRN